MSHNNMVSAEHNCDNVLDSRSVHMCATLRLVGLFNHEGRAKAGSSIERSSEERDRASKWSGGEPTTERSGEQ